MPKTESMTHSSQFSRLLSAAGTSLFMHLTYLLNMWAILPEMFSFRNEKGARRECHNAIREKLALHYLKNPKLSGPGESPAAQRTVIDINGINNNHSILFKFFCISTPSPFLYLIFILQSSSLKPQGWQNRYRSQ